MTIDEISVVENTMDKIAWCHILNIFPKFYISLLVKDEKNTEGIKWVETLHFSAYWYQNSTDNLLKNGYDHREDDSRVKWQ
jgi:hypothetical protein